MKFRSHFDYDVTAASDEATVFNSSPSLTIQSQTADCDMNSIVERYKLTGTLPPNPRVPMYGDFTSVSDFKSALAAVEAAHDAFMEFPAGVRARFYNDPQKLLEFVSDDGNMDEARKLGLLKVDSDGYQGASGKGGGSRAAGQAVQPGQGVSGSPTSGSPGPASGGSGSGLGGE